MVKDMLYTVIFCQPRPFASHSRGRGSTFLRRATWHQGKEAVFIGGAGFKLKPRASEEDILSTNHPAWHYGTAKFDKCLRICFMNEPQKWRKQVGSDRAPLEKSILLQQ